MLGLWERSDLLLISFMLFQDLIVCPYRAWRHLLIVDIVSKRRILILTMGIGFLIDLSICCYFDINFWYQG